MRSPYCCQLLPETLTTNVAPFMTETSWEISLCPFSLVCCLPTLHTVVCLDAQSCPTLCDPMDCSPPGSSVHGESPGKNMEWVATPSSRGSCQPRERTQVSCIAGRFFTSETPGKLKNTGAGSLSLLQGIFPAQELNEVLQHCRRILYQLSYIIICGF